MFMTTNYEERLDPALKRPGRVDVKRYIGDCDHLQIKKMFQKFYPEETEASALRFADEVVALNTPVSAAQIQGFLMFFKASPGDAIENAYRFKPKQE